MKMWDIVIYPIMGLEILYKRIKAEKSEIRPILQLAYFKTPV
jgi:hypothetical protein